MGTDISPGTTLVDGQLVHDADLNALVGDATILATAISAKTLKSTMSLGDELLINDSGTLKKVTGQQIVQVSAIPAGCVMQYAGATEPLGWMFCYGQEISRTTYAALFTAIGTAYGAGDGSTTFKVPDCRGRVTAGKDNMGGTSADRITEWTDGLNGETLGSAGGSESHELDADETPVNVPAHTHTVGDHQHLLNGVDHLHSMQGHVHYLGVYNAGSLWSAGWDNGTASEGQLVFAGGGQYTGGPNVGTTAAADRSLAQWSSAAGAATTSASAAISTGGDEHNNVQPTIIMNTIIKT